MAMRRIPPRGGPTPVELLQFRPEDWPPAEGELPDVAWGPAYVRWQEARRAYAPLHPNSELGDLIDMLREEVKVHGTMCQWRPLERLGPVRIYDREVTEGVYDPRSGKLRGRLKGEEDVPAGGTGLRPADWI
jgi:hypothetical protein